MAEKSTFGFHHISKSELVLANLCSKQSYVPMCPVRLVHAFLWTACEQDSWPPAVPRHLAFPTPNRPRLEKQQTMRL